MIVASTRDVDEAVREIREWGKSKWAVAVMPLLAKDSRPTTPTSTRSGGPPQEYDLPIANHSFTWTPPYYPGYRDLWDNIFLGRLAAHPWGAMRFVAVVHRRRPVRPLSEAADGRARMRLRLAAVLGPAHGRAGGLCRRHRAAEA